MHLACHTRADQPATIDAGSSGHGSFIQLRLLLIQEFKFGKYGSMVRSHGFVDHLRANQPKLVSGPKENVVDSGPWDRCWCGRSRWLFDGTPPLLKQDLDRLSLWRCVHVAGKDRRRRIFVLRE